MDARIYIIVVLSLYSVVIDARRPEYRKSKDPQRNHKNRPTPADTEYRRKVASDVSEEIVQKPKKHILTTTEKMGKDEGVEVAIDPKPMHLKNTSAERKPYHKQARKSDQKQSRILENNTMAVNLIKDIIVELGRELLTRRVGEDFVFGQYIGNALSNFTKDVKLRLQHDILGLIVKYQNIENDYIENSNRKEEKQVNNINDTNDNTNTKFHNDTEDNLVDFQSLTSAFE